jgi:hypothetical protein
MGRAVMGPVIHGESYSWGGVVYGASCQLASCRGVKCDGLSYHGTSFHEARGHGSSCPCIVVSGQHAGLLMSSPGFDSHPVTVDSSPGFDSHPVTPPPRAAQEQSYHSTKSDPALDDSWDEYCIIKYV